MENLTIRSEASLICVHRPLTGCNTFSVVIVCEGDRQNCFLRENGRHFG